MPKAGVVLSILEVTIYALLAVIVIYIIGSVYYDPELSGKPKFAFLQMWSLNYNIITHDSIFVKQAGGTNFNILGIPEVVGGPPRVWIILNAENDSDLYPYPRIYIYPDNVAYVLSCDYLNKLQSTTEIKRHVRIYLKSNCL